MHESEQNIVVFKHHIFSYISYYWTKYLRYCGMLSRNNHTHNHRIFKNNKTVTCKNIGNKTVAHCLHIFNKLIFLYTHQLTHKT